MADGEKWSLRAFARKYNINYAYLRQLLGGKRNLSEKSARKMECRLGLDDGFLTKPVTSDEISSDVLDALTMLQDMSEEKRSDAIKIISVIKESE